MKAVAYTQCRPSSDPEALLDLELPDPPAPKGRDLLVEVRAVSVNPLDAKQRGRADPKGEPKILGFDAAGVVRAVGPEARMFSPGNEVFYAGAVNRPGSNARLQLVDERIVGLRPARLDFAESAALPLTSITAWEALFDRLRIPHGASGGALLVVGGAGGVGSMAIQLARALTGLTVIATASRPETREWCEGLGAHHVVDHAGDLAAQVKALGVPVPFIFCTTQTERHWRAICDIVAPQGLVCAIDEPMTLEVGRLKPKAAGLVWEAMFARILFRTADIEAQHQLLKEVSRLADAGTIRSTLTRRLGPISAAALLEGHRLVEEGRMIGKAVAEGWGDPN
ncbi:zinc-binding alcohol dehydrogenase family protein [Sabulicella glaciei]|uniref:Zinc-type alcohol dehydrogenase-like protein n=1 Tax=Sabulicella glaciei TaxID=2984948 RepID=A0ABT3NX28_9PROT|nr:zinc-binding alcohol dehydrogenase family protein [Roseococcus sp. MDT2-1-1]MCW8086714.1 zinc-binding alcohol dehydrogenase family protein [Roseococcus sp. MDT2-1-1]